MIRCGAASQSSRSRNAAPRSASIFRVKLVYHCWKTDKGIGVSGLKASFSLHVMDVADVRELDVPAKGVEVVEQLDVVSPRSVDIT